MVVSRLISLKSNPLFGALKITSQHAYERWLAASHVL
jgi:hypothetical protein